MEPFQVFIKKELYFMENSNNTPQLHNLNIQEMLMKALKECDDLKEELTRSKENENKSNEREKRAQERYDKFFKEQLEITSKKDEIITKLNDKVSCKVMELDELKKRNSQTLEELRERIVLLEKEKNMSDETEKRTQERYDKFFQDQSEITSKMEEKITELNDKVNFRVLEIEALKKKNSQTVEELKERILLLEKEKNKSDQEFLEMKKKKMEVEKAFDELSRKKVEAFRTIEEFRDLVGAVDEVFEERNRIWDVFRDKVHALGGTAVKEGCGYLHRMPKQINMGGGKGDDSPGQAVLQSLNCSPQVEADFTDLEKGSERSSGAEGPVQVADSYGEELRGEDYSDSPANLAEYRKTKELASVDGSLGQAVLQSPNYSPPVEADCPDLEKGTARSPGAEGPVQVADSDGKAIPSEDTLDLPANLAGKGKTNALPSVDGCPGQAVLHSPNCSRRVEANCIDLEKGTESTPVAEGPVQVSDSDGEAMTGALVYNLDSPANLAGKGKTDELTSLKLPLSLISSTLKRKRGTHENLVEYLQKGQKKERVQKRSRKRKKSMSLNLSKMPNPALKRCKKKKTAVASDSQIPIWNVDSSSSDDDIVRS